MRIKRTYYLKSQTRSHTEYFFEEANNKCHCFIMPVDISHNPNKYVNKPFFSSLQIVSANLLQIVTEESHNEWKKIL